MNWSDARMFYRYSEYGRAYKEYSLDDPYLSRLFARAADLAILLGPCYTAAVRHSTTRARVCA
jgi:hypothetical protein